MIIGTTNGVFDLITPGHIYFLNECKKNCDILICLLNTDESVRRLGKGEGRPYVNEWDRLLVIRGLRDVDAAYLFNDSDPSELLKQIKPDIHFKDDEYKDKNIPEEPVMKEIGGIVCYIPRLPWSTTSVVDRIKNSLV